MKRSFRMGLCTAAAMVAQSSGAALSAGEACEPQWWNANIGLTPGFGTILAVVALTQFDPDGDGPLPRHLYLGGFFNFSSDNSVTKRIARWDGFQMTPVGQGIGESSLDRVYDICAYDPDGSGPQPSVLVAGGAFFTAGGTPVSAVAQLVNGQWRAIGSGLTLFVFAVEAFDPDGAGPQTPWLVAGGNLAAAGADPVRYVAAWDGSAWRSLGDGGGRVCWDLKSWDEDGPGPVHPRMFSIDSDTQLVFEWSNDGWQSLGFAAGPTGQAASAFAELDPDGGGPLPSELYLASSAGIRRHDQGLWTIIAPPVPTPTIAWHDPDGAGPQPHRLFAGGYRLRMLDEGQWIEVADPEGAGLLAMTLHSFDSDGGGPRPASLLIAGDFTGVSGVPAHGLARFGCDETWETCVGDATRDKRVNYDDVTKVLSWWGMDGAHPEAPDLNRDNVVGATDVVAVLTSYGSVCETAARPGAAAPGDGSDRIESFAEMTRRLATWGAE